MAAKREKAVLKDEMERLITGYSKEKVLASIVSGKIMNCYEYKYTELRTDKNEKIISDRVMGYKSLVAIQLYCSIKGINIRSISNISRDGYRAGIENIGTGFEIFTGIRLYNEEVYETMIEYEDDMKEVVKARQISIRKLSTNERNRLVIDIDKVAPVNNVISVTYNGSTKYIIDCKKIIVIIDNTCAMIVFNKGDDKVNIIRVLISRFKDRKASGNCEVYLMR